MERIAKTVPKKEGELANQGFPITSCVKKAYFTIKTYSKTVFCT
jgi:hypothetical protein